MLIMILTFQGQANNVKRHTCAIKFITFSHNNGTQFHASNHPFSIGTGLVDHSAHYGLLIGIDSGYLSGTHAFIAINPFLHVAIPLKRRSKCFAM